MILFQASLLALYGPYKSIACFVGLFAKQIMSSLQVFVDKKLLFDPTEIVIAGFDADEYSEWRNLKGDGLVIENASILQKVEIDGRYIGEKLRTISFMNCPNLEEIRFIHHKLVAVTIKGCPRLRDVNFYNNRLSDLDGLLGQLDPEIVASIWLVGNQFKAILEPFAKFTEIVYLGVSENQFYGSLEPLQKLRKLSYFIFEKTDIDSGLEYLDMDPCDVCCGYDEDKKYKVVTIQRALNKYGQFDNQELNKKEEKKRFNQSRNLIKWREEHVKAV